MIWSVVGYVRIKLCGDNIRLFFDECLKKDIALKNVLCLKGVYRADVLSTNLKRLVPVAKKCDIKIDVEGRFGLAMKLFIYRNRLAFFIPLIFLFFVFCANSFFIKNIVVNGNTHLTEKQITTLLSECGISEGSFIPLIKANEIQSQMMIKCNSLSWIWVDIKGTTANVDVREKVPKPEFFNEDFVCNIVAKRDGVITEVISECGIPYAKSGIYVQKGELLIGGVYDSNDYAPVRFVHASGKVYARTTYTLQGDFPPSVTSYTLSEKARSKYGILFLDKKFDVDFKKSKSKYVKTYSKEKYFKLLGKFSLPLGFTNNKYCEIIKTECKLDKETAVSEAVEDLMSRLSSKLSPGTRIVNTTKEIGDNSDGTISVTVTIECIEDIGEELPIILSE